MHLIVFQRWGTKMNFIDPLCFFSSKKAKMRLKQRKKFVLGWTGVVSVHTGSRNWARNFSVQDLPRSGQPTEIKNDEFIVLVNENPQSTAQETTDTLNITHSSVIHHLHQIEWPLKSSNLWPQRTQILACFSFSPRKNQNIFEKGILNLS